MTGINESNFTAGAEGGKDPDHPLGAPTTEMNAKINDLFGAAGGSEEVVSETGSESNLRSSNRRRDAIHVEDDLKDFEIQYQFT